MAFSRGRQLLSPVGAGRCRVQQMVLRFVAYSVSCSANMIAVCTRVPSTNYDSSENARQTLCKETLTIEWRQWVSSTGGRLPGSRGLRARHCAVRVLFGRAIRARCRLHFPETLSAPFRVAWKEVRFWQALAYGFANDVGLQLCKNQDYCIPSVDTTSIPYTCRKCIHPV